MALRGGDAVVLVFFWITFSCSTLGNHFKARIRVTRENAEFLQLCSPDGRITDILKLILDPMNADVYAGTPNGLYMLKNKTHLERTLVNVPVEPSECPGCNYSISLLKEGRDGYPLFMCRTAIKLSDPFTKCCDVSSEKTAHNCTEPYHPSHISEPSLHVGDLLYYTVSANTKQSSELPCGIYRWDTKRATMPVLQQSEQRYFKIIADKGSGPLGGKVYTFFIEKNKDQGPEKPIWITLVSQICLADRGGKKAVLEKRWTSMLTARLFCGDEKRHLSYTELLDIVVLEDMEWQKSTIYALFKNDYNLTALCVYHMSDILNVFKSDEFTSATDTSSPRPGECVLNSQELPSTLLNFMKSRPEMKQWIKPVRDPLMFRHHHYTHLQVDRVNSTSPGNGHHEVLLMSLECGKVHKILEQDGKPFIIAQYEPFTTRTHISSMLLDSINKQLFVSSSSEVMQIDLHNCSMYRNSCKSCVMARDPYCSWGSSGCSNKGSGLQNITSGSHSVCEEEPRAGASSTFGKRQDLTIIQDTNFYLKCPRDSHHASYVWMHQERQWECVFDGQDCFLLIDRMSEKSEGVYKCISSENGFSRTVVSAELKMNSGSDTRTSLLALSGFLLLINVIY